ncbi:CvpA family protein [Rubinisphaera margarita]|uniref:CvpA family protein n=1 Tax=Rubinisphaera margarita TaxID=2909586 RepID=UPI001EE89B29|nr:CvpA family protein [Rubinisphaera margarita]MCG6158356.1 CvpA family protein [Rubinisphaera margarita]
MIDLFLIAVIAVTAWCVASEGAWGAALTFLSVLFAGIIAMNYFEPLAEAMSGSLGLGPSWQNRWDFLSLMLLFIGFTFVFRLGSEQILPVAVEVHPLAFDGVRWFAGVMTGYLTAAFILTTLHTAPVPLNYVGFEPERDNLLGMAAPDRQWLGFVQYMTEKPLTRPGNHIFDGAVVRLSNGQEKVIPTFAIRYATRRGQTTGGTTQPTAPPAPAVAPSSGNRMPF